MKQKIRVGIIGAGFIGAVHIESLRRTGLCEVVAVADIDLRAAQKLAERWDVSCVYSDYTALIADSNVDSVHIATPNYLHFEIAKSALEAGKHVVCEKPLVCNLEEADRLVKIAEDSGKVHAISFNLRYYPLVQQARMLVQDESFGRAFSYHGSYLQDWLMYLTDYSWRVNSEVSGPSRAVSDIGSHWMDMAEFILGQKILAVCAELKTFHPIRKKAKGKVLTFQKVDKEMEYEDMPIDTEDYASLLLRFENGTVGNVIISQAAAGRKNYLNFEVDGEYSSLAWNSENPNELWIGNRDTYNQMLIKDPKLMSPDAAVYTAYPGGHTEGFADTSTQFFTEVYSYILRDGLNKREKMPFPNFKDGKHEVELCEAILKSGKNHEWVEL